MTETDIILTIIGGNELSKTIRKTPALIGYETGNTRPPTHTIEFCDYPFTKDHVSFSDHLAVVREEQPKYAVAPDIEHKDKLNTVLEQADELGNHAETVIVVPKAVHPDRIPSRYRVGVPLANYGSDASWSWDAYNECEEIHLLGGSPTKQLEFSKYNQNVRSADGASVVLAAQKGDIWAPTHQKSWHETGADQYDYYERIAESVTNIYEAWNGSQEFSVPIDPDQYDDYVRPRVEKVEVDRDYREIGARGAEPFIHERDAVCLGPEEREMVEVIDWDDREQAARDKGVLVMNSGTEQSGLGNFV